jgi:hypothetical protein
MKIHITSPAFEEGQGIPVVYTCEGDDSSPPLRWSAVPPTAKSIAVICDDPDAPLGTWVHWVLYNLPATATKLEAKVPSDDALPGGARQGINDFHRVGYGGPCPPPGKPHRYFFKIYALDAVLAPMQRATREQLLAAMQGHVVAEGALMGTYKRQH